MPKTENTLHVLVTRLPQPTPLFSMQQPSLIDIPEQPEQQPFAQLPPQPESAAKPQFKLREADRSKLVLTAIELDKVLPDDHKARAIVELLKQVNLAAFYSDIRTIKGRAGRSMRDPKTLIAVILYGISEGIGSMRELSALCEHDPALLWLTGLDPICHTELSEFRREQKAGLDELSAQLLVMLDRAKVISLDQVTLDGTRIRTFAGIDTLRSRNTIAAKLEQARELLRKMEAGEGESASDRRKRAQRERIEQLEAARREVEKLAETAKKDEEQRVSTTEPEARVMKTGQGEFVSAYNVQLVVESTSKAIVNAEVTNAASDNVHFASALEQVNGQFERMPSQVLADGAYITVENLETAEAKGVDLVGPLPNKQALTEAALKRTGIDPAFGPQVFVWDAAANTFVCPAGKALQPAGKQKKDNKRVYDMYRAAASDCAGCAHRRLCVQVKRRAKGQGRELKVLRPIPVVVAQRAKMATAEAKAAYRKRGETAEFPNAWLKEKFGLRKFRLRGLIKAGIEVLWAVVAYNLAVWRREVWLPELKAA